MTRITRFPSIWLLAALLVCSVVYWPGLSGGFVYDDFAFIVTNQAVHVQSLDWFDWVSAANSFPAAHQGRWAGMVSFAANHYLGGLDPWGYKLTNLCIHLLNGWLVWLMLTALLKATRVISPLSPGSCARDRFFVAVMTALWLILPINLTSVLYVSQRLESLSNTFVLFGLLWYLRVRLRDWLMNAVALRLFLTVLLCTIMGVLVKESAVLLPLYIGCLELVIFGFRRQDGSVSHAAVRILIAALLVPLVVGAVWLASWIGTDRAYSRSFDTYERLLTQGRVLMMYVKWSLIPSLSELSLYHDDIVVSRGLLSPSSTLGSLMCIVSLATLALCFRRKIPLFALGVLWFFSGHMLTSTVIPLMLAFEHRNYFPSIGLLLAMASLFGLEVKVIQPRTQWLIFGSLTLFYLGTTQLRVLEWSDPIRLASSQAAKRPNSVDAQYDYAHTLMRYSESDPKSPAIDAALSRLRASREMPGSGILFDHAILILEARRGEPENLEHWAAMRRKAASQNARASDVSAVFTLYECMQSGLCVTRYEELLSVVDAFTSHPQADGRFFALKGALLASGLGDLKAIREAYDRALDLRPQDGGILANYVEVLIKQGALSEAQAELDKLRTLPGSDLAKIADSLQATILQQSRAAQGTSPR